MKKIYSFIALMLFLFVGTAQAQRTWNVDDQSGSVATIEEGKYYALHCGFNPGYGNNGYMHTAGGEMNTPGTFSDAYVYEFIKVSEKSANGETFNVYILKNLGNSQYLAAGGVYTSKKTEAFRFTARKSTAMTFAGGASEDWYEYSTQVIDQEVLDDGQNERQNCPGSVAAGSWVFCSPTEDVAIAYIGNGGTSGYHDTRDWLVYPVSEITMTAYQRLGYYYDLYCQNEVNEENYPIGNNPGYVDSQAAFDRYKAAYDAAVAAYANTGLSDDQYNAVTDELIAAYEEFQAHLVGVTPGYYMFISQRSQDALKDNNGSVAYTQAWAAPETWTLSNANVIWEVVKSGEDGKFYMRNFATGKYIGKAPKTSEQFTMVADTVAKFTFEVSQGQQFVINQNGSLVHCAGGYNAVTWNDRNAEGNRHLINKVDPAIIAALQEKADSLQNSNKWRELVDNAESTLAGTAYNTECTFNGDFTAAGLATAATGNHDEPNEGPIANLFDKNTNTFYHSAWSTDAADGNNDWIDVDLGKEVTHAFLKIARRPNTSFNCAPLDYKLWTVEEGIDDATDHNAAWSKLLKEDSVVYEYAGTYGSVSKDNHVAIIKLDFDEPVQYLRFEVLSTPASKHPESTVNPENLQKRPSGVAWWNLAEFRVYENLGEDPNAAFIPESVKTALQNAIDAAKAEIAAGQFNEATYTALEDALDAFNESYPDPSSLANLLNLAHNLATTADETQTGLGYFQEGATEELNAALAAIEAEVLDGEGNVKAMSKDDLAKYEAQVNSAIDTFNSKLNKPEAGHIYMIRSGSENENLNGSYVYAANAHLNESAYWGYQGDADYSTRVNLFWEVVDAGNGKFALKNVATGRYINNPYLYQKAEDIPEATQIKFTENKDALEFTYAAVAGMFNIKFADGHYFNTDPAGNIATWYDVEDYNARFEFVEVEEWDGTYTFSVEANAIQIVSLPVSVSSVMVGAAGDPAYKVIGQKGGMLQLQTYGDDEEIPAGTPFIVEAPAQDDETVTTDNASCFPSWTLEDVEYSYTSLEQNGLYGAVLGATLPANVGIFFNNKIVLTDEEEYVAPGSGYIIAEIPETTEDGEYQIALPAGMATGINNAVIVKNDNAVYSVSGVKVRNNSVNINNLPKGVYIIGGKKVIVK